MEVQTFISKSSTEFMYQVMAIQQPTFLHFHGCSSIWDFHSLILFRIVTTSAMKIAQNLVLNEADVQFNRMHVQLCTLVPLHYKFQHADFSIKLCIEGLHAFHVSTRYTEPTLSLRGLFAQNTCLSFSVQW